MDILNITQKPLEDISIEEYEFHEYVPVSTTLNSFGDIRITIQSQDLFSHPSESFLLIEGQLLKTDNNLYGNDDAVSLTNNGIMHLFSNIKYQLSGQEIESINFPGQGTTMLGLLTYPDDFSKSQGLNQLWYKDTSPEANPANNIGFSVRNAYVVQQPDPKGTFSFRIPLRHIFGFCEDYYKVIWGFTQTITLSRKADDDAIFRMNGVAEGKVRLDKISWFVPHVIPSDADKMKLYKVIEQKTKIQVGYRIRQCDSTSVPQTTNFTWRLGVRSSPNVPRFILVAFQTEWENDQEKNTSIFDHVNVKNIFVTLNSKRYPAVDYDISFPKQKFGRIYGDSASFRKKFYNLEELVSNPNITPTDFKSLFPIFVFDVSKQAEKLKYSTTDIQIKASFENNVPEGTQAYAMLISDQTLFFQSDGNKLHVVN